MSLGIDCYQPQNDRAMDGECFHWESEKLDETVAQMIDRPF